MRYLLYLLCCCSVSAFGQKIEVTGSWSPTLTPPLVAGANYASSSLESGTGDTKIKLMPQSLYLIGTVSVSTKIAYSGTPWPSELTLSLRRTGTGSAGISIATFSGGLSYQQLTTTDTPFFSVNILISLLSEINNIPVQYQLNGISVLRPIGNYSATVTYTVSP